MDDGGRVATLTLTRAHCLDLAGQQELTDTLETLATNNALRVLIVTAIHPEAFLVDVRELATMTPAQAQSYSRSGQRLTSALAAFPTPTIAAIPGAALGGGCEFVLACDLTYAADSATFGQIEASGGVIPAFGGTWRLARRVGFQRACEMIFTAAVVDAKKAREWGLVLAVIADSELLAYCARIANGICATSRQSVAEAKRVLVGGWGLPTTAADAMEQGSFSALFGTNDQRQRMDAFLTSTRGPVADHE